MSARHTLKFYDRVSLSGGQGAVRRAILYADSSCVTFAGVNFVTCLFSIGS